MDHGKQSWSSTWAFSLPGAGRAGVAEARGPPSVGCSGKRETHSRMGSSDTNANHHTQQHAEPYQPLAHLGLTTMLQVGMLPIAQLRKLRHKELEQLEQKSWGTRKTDLSGQDR